MKTYTDLVAEALESIEELFPWDLVEMLDRVPDTLLIDIREPDEFRVLHIDGSLNVPRGVLEGACEYGYEDTVAELAAARDREVVLVCRSGNRSALAADVMQQMGFAKVRSLKTGLRGWNDYEQPFKDGADNAVEIAVADAYFALGPRPDQMAPAL